MSIQDWTVLLYGLLYTLLSDAKREVSLPLDQQASPEAVNGMCLLVKRDQ